MHIYACICHLFAPITELSVSILSAICRATFVNGATVNFFPNDIDATSKDKEVKTQLEYV